ncbi:MAG: hypothetical protein M1822_010025 [Bathelium mastoideum]|nr:MAG: hypothetical protein M1822_010025 [Bathelium mastoideum]
MSPLRHLPTAKQAPLLERFFKEANAFHFERWINELPDAECIRYFGFLNSERLLLTSAASVNQAMRLRAVEMEKQYGAKTQLQRVSGATALVVTEGEFHRKQRRMMEPLFRLGQIKSVYCPLFWRKSIEMLEVIRMDKQRQDGETLGREGSTQICNMDDIFGRTVFDITGEASMTHDWKALSSPELYWRGLQGYRDAMAPSTDNRNRILLAFVLPTWLVNTLPIRFNRRTGRQILKVREICRKVIEAKRRRSAKINVEKNDMDIIDSAMRTNHIHTMSFEELQDQALMFQSGGVHSTVVGLLSTIYLLAQSQDSQTRLRDEIREMLPPCSPGSTVNPETFARMPYLDAVFNEVMRLQSAFSWTGRIPTKHVTLVDTKIPKNTSLSISPWALHRSFKLWGEDAKEFKPERWLNGGATVPRELCTFISFGAGPHKCIGEEFARFEMKCVIAALFGRYNVTFPKGQALPGITHQTGVAFRKPIMPQLELIEGW